MHKHYENMYIRMHKHNEHIYIYVSKYVHEQTYLHAYTYTYVHNYSVHKHVSTHKYMQICINTIHTHVHIPWFEYMIYTCMYLCIGVCMCVHVRVCILVCVEQNFMDVLNMSVHLRLVHIHPHTDTSTCMNQVYRDSIIEAHSVIVIFEGASQH